MKAISQCMLSEAMGTFNVYDYGFASLSANSFQITRNRRP